MSSEDEEFYQKFQGYTIPKKKPKEIDTETKNKEKEVEEGEIVSPQKENDTSKEEKSPLKRPRKVSRKSINDFLSEIKSGVGTADPLGLEPIMTYGEAKGTRHTSLEVFLSKYDGNIPEKILCQSTDLKCDLCSVDFSTSIQVAKSHYAGKNHAKKFKSALENWHNEDPENNLMPQLKPESEVSSTSETLSFYENRSDHDETYCHICRLELTSKIVATQHYQGKAHAKELRKRMAPGYVPKEDFPPTAPKKSKFFHTENQSVISDAESRQGSGNRFFCLECKLHFKSNDQFTQHLKSGEHKAKKNEESTESNPPTLTYSVVPTNDSIDQMLSQLRANPQSAFYCSLCQVPCSSQLTLDTHLSGKQHKKKLEMSQQGPASQFRCDVCNLETTDQNGLDMHLAGKKHQKKLNALQNK